MSFLNSTWYEGGLIDIRQQSLLISLSWIIFNPLFWNITARLEHSTKFLTKALGSPYRGCYFLAVVIFSIGILRDNAFKNALIEQPTHPALDNYLVQILAKVSFGIGTTFVVTSMWALGVTGTYLGDYFGILMDDMVTGFPFNMNSSPMYDGSTLCFLGTALSYKSPAGIILSGIVYILYKVALTFEDPFTAKIYRERASKSK